MRTAALNEDSVVEDGQAIALPVGSESARNMVLATGSAVQVIASGSDSIRWPQQATPQANSVVVPAGSSLTFFYTLGVWWVVAEGSVPLLNAGAGLSGQVLTTGGTDPSGLSWTDGFTNASPSPWTLLAPAAAYTQRSLAAAAYDEHRSVGILFGGLQGASLTQDTWKWDNSTWSLLSLGTKPSIRSSSAMAEYAVSATFPLILFGGVTTGNAALGDTWSWNGAAWSSLSPASSPSARSGHTMVWHATSQKIYLFGGTTSTVGPVLNDLWSWNGTTWTNITPAAAVSPPPRAGHAMAYDPASDAFFLFGGTDASNNYLTDTWRLDPGTPSWSQLQPSVAPRPRVSASFCADPVLGKPVLVGGLSPASSSGASVVAAETWVFDSATATWNQISATPAPSKSGAVAWSNPVNNTMELFGGASTTETWSFTTPNVGAPTSGAWLKNQTYEDNYGQEWVCTASGTPGTWLQKAESPWSFYYPSPATLLAPPSMRARLESPAFNSIANGGGTMSYSIFDEDTWSGFGGSTSTYTIKRAGWYTFSASVLWASNSTGGRGIWFTSGAVGWPMQTTGQNAFMPVLVSSGTNDSIGRTTATGSFRFAVGDTLSVFVFQGSGGALTANEGYFGLTWIHD